MSITSDDSLLAAGAGDKIVLFEMIYSSLAILTFVEKHPGLAGRLLPVSSPIAEHPLNNII